METRVETKQIQGPGKGWHEDKHLEHREGGGRIRRRVLTEECAELEWYVPHQSSWNPKSIDIDKRPDRKFRQGFIGALGASGRESNR